MDSYVAYEDDSRKNIFFLNSEMKRLTDPSLVFQVAAREMGLKPTLGDLKDKKMANNFLRMINCTDEYEAGTVLAVTYDVFGENDRINIKVYTFSGQIFNLPNEVKVLRCPNRIPGLTGPTLRQEITQWNKKAFTRFLPRPLRRFLMMNDRKGPDYGHVIPKTTPYNDSQDDSFQMVLKHLGAESDHFPYKIKKRAHMV